MNATHTLRPLDRGRPEPLYYQLEMQLRERIQSGEWPPGAKIPTEDHLGTMYRVSRITVRQALRNLVDGGYLERGQGRGTFVREPVLMAGERGLRSFSEDMRALALSPGARVLEANEIPARGVVAEQLGLRQGASVHRLKRLRTGDGKPIGLQTSHLPVRRFPNLARHLRDGASLYTTLRARYGVTLEYAREAFSVVLAQSDEASLLGIAAGAPAFRVERVACDESGPLEYTVSVMRGDRYRIEWVLRARPSTHEPLPAPEGGTT